MSKLAIPIGVSRIGLRNVIISWFRAKAHLNPLSVDEVAKKTNSKKQTIARQLPFLMQTGILEMVEEKSSEEILDILVDFQPDPQTRTVMENLVKNISVKVKLINLLRDGNVKEVTFTRLFESYESQGDRWKNRRIEELERSRYNLDTMEKTLADTKMKLEELEIRKAIGDASDKEYQAKSPAFKWEIDELENELKQRKGEIAYLENLDRAIPVEDMEELRATVESRQAFLNNLIEEERISSETATKINASLERIVNYIDNPNNY